MNMNPYEDNKRQMFAVLICILIILLYSELFIAPSMRESAQQAASERPSGQQSVPISQDQVAPHLANGLAPIQPSISQGSSLAHPQMITQVPTSPESITPLIVSTPPIVIKTPTTRIELTPIGGRFRKIELLNYAKTLKSHERLNVLEHVSYEDLPGALRVAQHSDRKVSYTLKEVRGGRLAGEEYLQQAGETLTIILEGDLTESIKISKSFSFKDTPYTVYVDAKLSQPVIPGAWLWLETSMLLSDSLLKSRIDPFEFVALNREGKRIYQMLAKNGEAPEQFSDMLWSGIGDKYFLTAIFSNQDQGHQAQRGHQDSLFFTRLAGGETDLSFRMFLGPKEYQTLKEMGSFAERGIDLGIFAFIAYPLLTMIRWFESWFGNYGLAIILLTLFIKFLFLPLTKASFAAMSKMQVIAPEMQKLRERLKDDPSTLNREVMALYKKHGVNPMSGCLPIVIQLPVFIGLYQALNYSLELRHAPFALWITDLSAPEYLNLFGLPIPVMVLLMGLSMYYQQITSPQIGDPQQQRIMKIMPVIFTLMFIIFPMPSGLVLYWLVSNIISIIQQAVLRSDKKANPYKVTLNASLVIFVVGYLLTLL